MTDADVDGAHIRTLILTLFFRYFPELIRTGHVYIAMPPLYQVRVGKNIEYAFSDEEKDALITKMTKGKNKPSAKEVDESSENDENIIEDEETEKTESKIKVNIQRYKGLGEMNPDQLWDTTMNPETRMMKQVAILDAEKASETFDILMGSDVAPRKKFIQTHAKNVVNLDI